MFCNTVNYFCLTVLSHTIPDLILLDINDM